MEVIGPCTRSLRCSGSACLLRGNGAAMLMRCVADAPQEVSNTSAPHEALPGKRWTRRRPFIGKVVDKESLTVIKEKGKDKETIRVTIDTEGSGLTYKPGDSLALRPLNDPKVTPMTFCHHGGLCSSPDERREQIILMKSNHPGSWACQRPAVWRV